MSINNKTKMAKLQADIRELLQRKALTKPDFVKFLENVAEELEDSFG